MLEQLQSSQSSTPKELRVLACAYACSPGGSAEAFGGGELVLGWNLVKQLGRFHQVAVLTATPNRANIESALSREPLPTVQFHYFDLPSWMTFLRGVQGGIQMYAYLWQVKAYFVARRLHREHSFDVFHHITYANDWMASFIGALLPVPYIRGPGGGAHRTPRELLAEYSIGGRIFERLRAAGQWIFRHDPFFVAGQRRARGLLVCNREALEAVPRKWRAKTSLFPVNGVSADDLRRFPLDLGRNGTFRVLTAGKLLRIKGNALALRAFRQFAARHSDAELVIVGDGPELSALRRLAGDLEQTHQVRFEDWMTHEKLLSQMCASDVFLFPSLRDGGGAVVVEAMAAGKPVVCLDLAGPGLHVTPECGMKITPSSPEGTVLEMAATLERLYQNKELRARMGQAARKRGEEHYHWDRLGEHLQEIYQKAFAQVVRPSHSGLSSDERDSPHPLAPPSVCGK
jgi:glycosyltransferase involved in cell wall biosynthesis